MESARSGGAITPTLLRHKVGSNKSRGHQPLRASNSTTEQQSSCDSGIGSSVKSSLTSSQTNNDHSAVVRSMSGGSARLSASNFRESLVKVHRSNSVKLVNTSEFTIDKLRFSSLGRLYGRDKEVDYLKSILIKRTLKEEPSVMKRSSTSESNRQEEATLKTSIMSATTDGATTSLISSTKKQVGFQDEIISPQSKHHKQLVIISGEAGSGKSVLALEAMPLVRSQKGFYLSGKFDQTEHRKPFSAVTTAFQSLCEDLLLHKGAQVDEGSRTSQTTTTMTTTTTPGYHRWNFSFNDIVEQIHEAFETEDLQLLAGIIPGLQKVMDADYGPTAEPPTEFFLTPTGDRTKQELNTTQVHAATSSTTTEDYAVHKVRIQSALKLFVRLICGFGPLVLVLDDVQWIDMPSLDLLESLLQDNDTPAMTIIATYRDNEMGEDHIFHQKLKLLELSSQDLKLAMHRIRVGAMDVDDICALLEDLISMQKDETEPLAECIHGKTGGNALYVKEFLLSLHREELLTFEFRLMRWEWDVEEIKVNAKSTDNVVALLNYKIGQLPALFSRLLPLVACLGCRFSMPMFDVVTNDCISDKDEEEALSYWHSIGNQLDASDTAKTTVQLSGGTAEEPKEQQFSPQEDVSNERSELVSGKEPSNEDNVSDARSQVLLAICEETGILTSCGQGWYKWEHDKVQEASMLFVGEEEFASFQFEVGKLLLQGLAEEDLAEVLFVVTSLLNSFTDSLDKKDELRIQIATLNYRSSVSAFQSSAFESAADFSQQGLALLPSNEFTNNYELSLLLHEIAAESLFSIGNFEKAKEYAKIVIQLDTALLDKRRVYKAYILSLAGQGLVSEAKDLTVAVLAKLGVKFPKRMRQFVILGGVLKLTGTLKKTTNKIDKRKILRDEKKIWAVDFLDRLVTYSYQAGDPDLLSLTMIKGAELVAKWGISDKSGPLLASTGLLLAIVGNYEGAKKYAELALKYANRATESRIRLISYRHVLHYQVPITVCKKAQMQGYFSGMKTGDIESAFWCIFGFCDDQFVTGVTLSIVVKDFAMYKKQISQFNHVMLDRCFRLGWQCALNLVDGTSGRGILNGDIMDEAEMIAEIENDKSDGQTIYNLMRLKILGCFWFKEYGNVVKIVEEMGFQKGTLEKALPGLNMTAATYFHCALSCLSVAREKQERKKGKYRSMARFFHSRIKHWCQNGNPNSQHYEPLIEAEFLTFKADNGDAKRMYERSIQLAGRLGITHDQALAHERLAENCQRLGYQNDAKYHFERALELFKDWGANARADILSKGVLAVPPAKEIISSGEFSADISTLSAGGASGMS